MRTARPLRVAFAGTPQFAVPPLEALLAAGHTLVGVLTQPDRPKGRGRQLTASPVKTAAQAHGLVVAQPATLRDAAGASVVANLNADILIVVAYGQILPPQILGLPRLGCLNIHASLLPRWRGAAPIQRALLAGDAETGVTVMQMDAGLDTGGILALRRRLIGPRDTSASLHEALAHDGAQLLLEVLEGLTAQRLTAQPQPVAGVTYAAKITKSEALIDWHAEARAVSCQVRAFNPWPVAQTLYEGEVLRVHDAYVPEGPAVPPAVAAGSWLGMSRDGEALRVACGRGELWVTRVQRANRNIVAAREFCAGRSDVKGHFG